MPKATAKPAPAPRVAVIPPRPATGAVISSAWGGSVHDRVYTPLACSASGANMLNLTANTRLALDTLVSGYNMVDAANNQLVIPVGGSGLYLVNACVQMTNVTAAVAAIARANIIANGVAQSGQMELMGLGGSGIRGTMLQVLGLSDGGTIAVDIYPVGSDPGDYMLRYLTIVRIGNGWGTAV